MNNVMRPLLATTALALAASLPLVASFAQAQPGAAAPMQPVPGTTRFHFGNGPKPAGAVHVAANTPYSAERGHGFEPPSAAAAEVRHFSVALPEGSYRITATLGGAARAGTVTNKAELRRLMLQNLAAPARRTRDASFTVHVRNALIAAGPNRAAGQVALRVPRESVDEAWNWDGKLTLEWHGAPALLQALRIEPVVVPLLFVLGDSTVADQSREPYASWGQMLPRWLGPGAAVVNLAQSGETFRDSLQRRRLDKILALARPGDTVLMQYGHNDQKQLRDGSGSVASYQTEMRQHLAALQAARLQPVLVTPVERRFFEPDGSLRATLADHVAAMRAVAAEARVPLLDLNAASRTLYAAHGPSLATGLFATGADGLVDPTHHNNTGAWLLAGLVAQGLQDLGLPIAAQWRRDAPRVRAAQPPALTDITIAASPLAAPQRPAGDADPAARAGPQPPTGSGAAPVYPERLARLHAAVQREIDQGRLAGAVTYLARHGQPVFFQAQGLARLEEQQPMRPDTLFRIASMSKAVTTVAAMMLYEEGHFLLRDPIHKWLPAFANVQVAVAPPTGSPPGTPPRLEKPRRAITVRDLLLHTAGLSYGAGPAAEEWRRAGFNDWYLLHLDETLAQWTERLARLPLQGHPGEAFQYGYATDVLGRLVEIWSGQPLDRFVEQRITGPLRMPDTHFFLPAEMAPRLAHVYALESGRLVLKETPANSDFLRGPRKLASGGAGLISSAPDYARFLQMLLNGGVLDGVRLLHPATVAMMTRDHLGTRFTGDAEGAGFGFWVALNPGTRSELASPGAYGWGSAYVPQYMVDPATQSVFIFLAQLRPPGDSTLNQRVKVLARQALADWPSCPGSDPRRDTMEPWIPPARGCPGWSGLRRWPVPRRMPASGLRRRRRRPARAAPRGGALDGRAMALAAIGPQAFIAGHAQGRQRIGLDLDHANTKVLQVLHRRVRGSRVGDDTGHAVEPAQHQPGAAAELRAVDEHDELLRLVDQSSLRLHEQRVGLHQPQGRDGVHPHEHLGGVVVAGDIVFEGADDHVLLTVDAAAGQDDLVLAGVQQPLGQQERVGQDAKLPVGQELGHQERGAAAVDDHRLAGVAQVCSVAGDRALLGGLPHQRLAEGGTEQRFALGTAQRPCTAPRALELLTRGQPGQIAPHGGGRGRQPMHQLRGAGCAVLVEQPQQALVAMVVDHEAVSRASSRLAPRAERAAQVRQGQGRRQSPQSSIAHGAIEIDAFRSAATRRATFSTRAS